MYKYQYQYHRTTDRRQGREKKLLCMYSVVTVVLLRNSPLGWVARQQVAGNPPLCICRDVITLE